MKRVMTGMKTVTTNLVDADQKLGEKKPDSKEVTPFQTNAAKLGNLNRQLFTMLSDAKCKEEARKINKGVSDLLKYAKKKDSNGMHDGISQIRATCGACHGCPGL
jgi:cytochrome c556